VVALRKNIRKKKGEHVLFDEIRYFFCRWWARPGEVYPCTRRIPCTRS
jgi:hypothetical protein